MYGDYYHFRLGAFDCTCVSDGFHAYPPRSLFANAPDGEVKLALRGHNMPADLVTTPYTYLVINTAEHKVLVDMGAGDFFPTTGKLPANMKAAGLAPDNIDAVVITHAHPDHIGGALDRSGKPVFANARYFIWKTEWDFWFSDAPMARWAEFAALARKVMNTLQDRMTLVDRESPILPGIGVLAAPGHTPGHLVVTASSQGEQLMYIGDTVISPLHLEHPRWAPVYDTAPDDAGVSKRRIFDLAASENVWVVGQHFPPFPSLGHVVKHGEGWLWQSADGSIF